MSVAGVRLGAPVRFPDPREYWDQAAGIIVVREAGGRVTEPAGLDSAPRSAMVVAAKGVIHYQVLSIVGAAMPVHLR